MSATQGGGTLTAILDRVVAAVAAAVPGLDAGDARLLVTEAASRRGALRQLDRHLAAFPGALASGSADAPKAVIALAGLLAGAGYPGIGVAACLACGPPLRAVRRRWPRLRRAWPASGWWCGGAAGSRSRWQWWRPCCW